MSKDSVKVGWYIDNYIVSMVQRLFVESKTEHQGMIAGRLMERGLAYGAISAVERMYWAEKSIYSMCESMLKTENRCMESDLKGSFIRLMGLISGFRRTKNPKYGLFLMDIDSILDFSKNRTPSTYQEFITIIKRFPKVYKDIGVLEPQNRSGNNDTNNIVSIELNDTDYIKAGKMRGHDTRI